MATALAGRWLQLGHDNPVLREVLEGVGLGVAIETVLAGLTVAGLHLRDGYRRELAPLCATSLSASGGMADQGSDRNVRRYVGTVADGLSAAGSWGDNKGPSPGLGGAVFVQVAGRDQPLALLRSGRRDPSLVAHSSPPAWANRSPIP